MLQVAEVPCDQWLYAVWDMEELQRETDKLVQKWPRCVWRKHGLIDAESKKSFSWSMKQKDTRERAFLFQNEPAGCQQISQHTFYNKRADS